MGIREMRKGSIIAELSAVILPNIINDLEASPVLAGFIHVLKGKFNALGKGTFLKNTGRSDLQSIAKSIRAISKDSDATAIFSHVEENRLLRTRKETKFFIDTKQARKMEETVDRQIAEYDRPEESLHRRVLMTFTRADIDDAKIERKSGELVLIEEISERPLPLIYQSELTEQKIKSEIRGGNSVFHKGFVVDVYVRTVRGKPAAYAVASLDDIIDLPRE